MATLRLAIGTCAIFQAALLAGSIVAIRAEDVWSGIAHVSLAKSSHKPISSVGVFLHSIFEHPRGNALVVSSSVGVIAEERSAMDGIPRKDSNILVVRGSLEAEECHESVSLVFILLTFGFGIGEVGEQGAVDGTVLNSGGASVQIALESV